METPDAFGIGIGLFLCIQGIGQVKGIFLQCKVFRFIVGIAVASPSVVFIDIPERSVLVGFNGYLTGGIINVHPCCVRFGGGCLFHGRLLLLNDRFFLIVGRIVVEIVLVQRQCQGR
jgi:hypothetical protein